MPDNKDQIIENLQKEVEELKRIIKMQNDIIRDLRERIRTGFGGLRQAYRMALLRGQCGRKVLRRRRLSLPSDMAFSRTLLHLRHDRSKARSQRTLISELKEKYDLHMVMERYINLIRI